MKPRLPEDKETQRKRITAYRKRCREEGFVRIEIWLEPDMEERFQQLMQGRKMGRKELFVALLQEASEKDGEK